MKMSLYSEKKVTARSFQWAIVNNKLEIKDLISKNPQQLRDKSLNRLGELDGQFVCSLDSSRQATPCTLHII